MTRRSFLPFLLFSVLSLAAVGCSPDPVVLEVGPDKVSLQDYERFYEKNMGTWDAAKQSSMSDRERFLDLLMNYKLKLCDAYGRNLLDESDVQSELKEYRTNVATTFLVDKELTEPALRAMYDRRKEELRARHILMRVSPSSTPDETLKAWNRAMDLISQLKGGKDFGVVAVENSEDPSARVNRGDLGYFTTGQMVTQFENGVYTMKAGEITSRPIRSNFGYHIVELIDRRPAVYSVKASHILISSRGKRSDSLAADSAFQKARALGDSIKAGADFAELAKKYSEDPGSAPLGGSLGYSQRRRLVQEFEQVAFAMKPGEISDIVTTKFGFHIIKCEDIKSVPPYEEIRGELLKLYQQWRYNEEYRGFVDNLRKKYGFVRHENVLSDLFSSIDTSKVPSDSLWAVSVSPDVRRKVIITVAGRSITVDSLIDMLSNRADYRNASLKPDNFPIHVDRVGDFLTLESASVGLEEEYPEFKSLMKEFQDGVVLYKAEQQEVWNRLEVNDANLRAFFQERSDQYRWPNRVEMIEISTDAETLSTRLLAELKKGRPADTVIARNKKRGKIDKTTRGLVPADLDELARAAWKKNVGELIGPVKFKGKYVLARITKKDPSRNKTFEEASAEISTVFQDFEAKRLERDWLERLKQKYPVIQNREHLARAFYGDKPAL